MGLPVLAGPFWVRAAFPVRSRSGKTASTRLSSGLYPAGQPQAAVLRDSLGGNMYAVIRAGGKQYKVSPGDVLRVEKMNGTDGRVEFDDVLAVSAEAGSVVRPGAGAQVTGEIVEEGRGNKILVFHYKRKKQYKKLRGHRQDFTAVRITEIAFDGQSFKAPELPKKEKKVKKAAAEGAGVKASARPAKKKAAKKAVAKKAAKKK
jgi:large subunit ribosomal protein L21